MNDQILDLIQMMKKNLSDGSIYKRVVRKKFDTMRIQKMEKNLENDPNFNLKEFKLRNVPFSLESIERSIPPYPESQVSSNVFVESPNLLIRMKKKMKPYLKEENIKKALYEYLNEIKQSLEIDQSKNIDETIILSKNNGYFKMNIASSTMILACYMIENMGYNTFYFFDNYHETRLFTPFQVTYDETHKLYSYKLFLDSWIFWIFVLNYRLIEYKNGLIETTVSSLYHDDRSYMMEYTIRNGIDKLFSYDTEDFRIPSYVYSEESIGLIQSYIRCAIEYNDVKLLMYTVDFAHTLTLIGIVQKYKLEQYFLNELKEYANNLSILDSKIQIRVEGLVNKTLKGMTALECLL